MNGIFANYFRTMYWSVFGLKEWVPIKIWIMWFFPRKYYLSKPIDVPYIHVYIWFKDDKHVIWMWIWLILTTNFIFWLNRLIFLVSINSHSDNTYILANPSIIVRPWHLKKYLTDTELAPSKVVLSIIYTSIDDVVIMCTQTIAEHIDWWHSNHVYPNYCWTHYVMTSTSLSN